MFGDIIDGQPNWEERCRELEETLTEGKDLLREGSREIRKLRGRVDDLKLDFAESMADTKRAVKYLKDAHDIVKGYRKINGRKDFDDAPDNFPDYDDEGEKPSVDVTNLDADDVD